jgi:hypothetical protein
VFTHSELLPQAVALRHSSRSTQRPVLHSSPEGQGALSEQADTHSPPTQLKSAAQSVSVVHAKRVVFTSNTPQVQPAPSTTLETTMSRKNTASRLPLLTGGSPPSTRR